jgi:hypothetical protein
MLTSRGIPAVPGSGARAGYFPRNDGDGLGPIDLTATKLSTQLRGRKDRPGEGHQVRGHLDRRESSAARPRGTPGRVTAGNAHRGPQPIPARSGRPISDGSLTLYIRRINTGSFVDGGVPDQQAHRLCRPTVQRHRHGGLPAPAPLLTRLPRSFDRAASLTVPLAPAR